MVEHKQKKQVGFVFDLVLLSVPGRSYKYHGEDCEESDKVLFKSMVKKMLSLNKTVNLMLFNQRPIEKELQLQV